jgi:hypothetical protein
MIRTTLQHKDLLSKRFFQISLLQCKEATPRKEENEVLKKVNLSGTDGWKGDKHKAFYPKEWNHDGEKYTTEGVNTAPNKAAEGDELLEDLEGFAKDDKEILEKEKKSTTKKTTP